MGDLLGLMTKLFGCGISFVPVAPHGRLELQTWLQLDAAVRPFLNQLVLRAKTVTEPIRGTME